MTFISWLLNQTDRDDPIGDLARDHARDVSYGCGDRVTTRKALIEHIRDEHVSDIHLDVMATVQNAWKEYRERSVNK